MCSSEPGRNGVGYTSELRHLTPKGCRYSRGYARPVAHARSIERVTFEKSLRVGFATSITSAWAGSSPPPIQLRSFAPVQFRGPNESPVLPDLGRFATRLTIEGRALAEGKTS